MMGIDVYYYLGAAGRGERYVYAGLHTLREALYGILVLLPSLGTGRGGSRY